MFSNRIVNCRNNAVQLALLKMRWTWFTIFFMAKVLWRQTNCCDPVPPPTPAPPPAPPPTPCEAVYPFTWYDWCEFSIDLISRNLWAKLKAPFAVLIMHLGGESTCGDQKSNVDVFNFGGASCLANTDVGKKMWNHVKSHYTPLNLYKSLWSPFNLIRSSLIPVNLFKSLYISSITLYHFKFL